MSFNDHTEYPEEGSYPDEHSVILAHLRTIHEPGHPCFANYEEFVIRQNIFSGEKLRDLLTVKDLRIVDIILFWVKLAMRCKTVDELKFQMGLLDERVAAIGMPIDRYDQERIKSLLACAFRKQKERLLSKAQEGESVRGNVADCLSAE